MTIIIDAAYLWAAAGVIAVIAAGVWYIRRRPVRIKFPPGYEQRLKRWTAEQLSTLTEDQQEAVRLWAWGERQGWRTVAENVHLGVEYPLAKKAIEP